MLELSSVRGIPVAYLTGDLDIASGPEVAQALEAAGGEAGRLIVSFERCRYCDSFAFKVLVSLRKQLGTAFVVVAPSGTQIRRVLDIAELSHVFPIVEDVESAARAIEQR
jgi:anti-anti-sigma factor